MGVWWVTWDDSSRRVLAPTLDQPPFISPLHELLPHTISNHKRGEGEKSTGTGTPQNQYTVKKLQTMSTHHASTQHHLPTEAVRPHAPRHLRQQVAPASTPKSQAASQSDSQCAGAQLRPASLLVWLVGC